MHLLHTSSLSLSDFPDHSKLPEYTILSHRWGDDEVSFQDLRCFTESDLSRRSILSAVFNVDITSSSSKLHGKGWDKIRRSCSFAKSRNFDWIWVDTCCINKESSSELSEAINSMFKWYQAAAECYAYLSDVSLLSGEIKGFEESQWFKRCWTLQELLAPKDLLFLDVNFQIIGSKQTLAGQIETMTGISLSIITHQSSMYNESIATRMSWAARRNSTRPEDIAYCLLGIFNINIPLLYGEGNASFRRLQEEIIRTSDDETIFAHSHTSHISPSVFAHHPRNFLRHKKIIRGLPARFVDSSIGVSSYTITNKGVQMRPPFVPFSIDSTERTILLNCHFEGDEYPVIVPVAAVESGDPFQLRKRSTVWRIRIHSDFKEQINTAKVYIDHALRYSAPDRRLVKDPFECETIYLR